MQLQALVLAFYSMAFFKLGEIAFLFNLFFSSLLGSKSPYRVSSGNYGDWPLSPYPAYWFNSSDFLHRKLRWKKTGSHKQRGKRKGECDWFPCLVGPCLYYLWCSCLQAVDQSVKILLHHRSALHCRSQRWVYATQRSACYFLPVIRLRYSSLQPDCSSVCQLGPLLHLGDLLDLCNTESGI